MNRIIKVSNLLIYILFTQVYPSVHWHAQEHHDDVELKLSVHPPEVIMDNFDHDNHHDQDDGHEHEDTHFDGDRDYIFQAKTISYTFAVKTFKDFVTLDSEPQVLSRIPKYIPLKIPSQHLPLTIPNRAPPFIL
jgi:hypothetical protein